MVVRHSDKAHVILREGHGGAGMIVVVDVSPAQKVEGRPGYERCWAWRKVRVAQAMLGSFAPVPKGFQLTFPFRAPVPAAIEVSPPPQGVIARSQSRCILG